MYVVKIDGDYYAGRNEKYADLYNISGMGVVGAKKMTLEETVEIRRHFEQPGIGRTVEVEEYNPTKYLMDTLKEIIVLDQKQREGIDVGYAIRNNAQKALKLLWEI